MVLVDFWAFECWNCSQTVPWLNHPEARYGSKGLVVVSVSTPELDQERILGNVIATPQGYRLTNPVMLDKN